MVNNDIHPSINESNNLYICREEGLKYIASLLNINSKRQQLQSNERMNAGDGFMLNLLSVMQLLCSKVRMDKVDPNYIHSDRCRYRNGYIDY